MRHLAHRADEARGLRLHLAKFGHAGFVLFGLDAFGLRGLLQPAPAAGHQHDNDADDNGHDEGADRGNHRDHKQRIEPGQPVPDQGETIHPAL